MRYFSRFNRFNAMWVMIISIMIAQKSTLGADCPCDIYSTGGTPCVAAYSTVRTLSSTYTGPLYQVRLKSDTSKTKDIYALTAGGVANAAAQDSFLGTGAGTISKLYDQSGKGNHLIRAPAGCYTGTAAQVDNESNAKGKSIYINGYKAYALYMNTVEGYRNNSTTGMPTGSQAQGIYEVADGTHYGDGCCWDFGNASINNCNGGTGLMNTLFFGKAYWGNGAGSGPWFMADFEAGVWAGGSKVGDGGWGALNDAHPANNNNPSMTMNYAFGILKTNSTNYAIRVANAQSGNLTTAYDGNIPSTLTWAMKGGIVLGIGGDNSNSSYGTFFEGVITSGRPTDAVDTLILKNVQAAGYGSTTTSVLYNDKNVGAASLFKINYNPSVANAIINYSIPYSRHMTMNVFNQQGKLVATLVDGVIPVGRYRAVWNTRQIPSGVYIVRATMADNIGWSGKIIIGK
jgi:non-reducing end alpha-L-arabinofuranosidase